MKQAQFEQLYAPQWKKFSDYLQQLEAGSSTKKSDTSDSALSRNKASGDEASRNEASRDEEYAEFAQLYRKLCHYHALARDRQYSSYLVDTLADLVARGHQQFYRRKHHIGRRIAQFLAVGFPVLVRREQAYVWWASALLYLPAVFFFLAIQWQPQLVFTVVSAPQVTEFEAMYNPANQILGSARDAETNWQMFGFYINNNISVAFRTFALGLVWGLGSIFFLVYNGLLFGAVAGHLTEVGYTHTFFSFVVGHGSFELTAIAIAGAAGLKLGHSLLAPGNRTRLESLRVSAAVAIRLVYGVIFMLIAAAFVEAFWSSSGAITFTQKYIVGALLWLLVIVYLINGGRRGSR